MAHVWLMCGSCVARVLAHVVAHLWLICGSCVAHVRLCSSSRGGDEQVAARADDGKRGKEAKPVNECNGCVWRLLF